jgi:transposase
MLSSLESEIFEGFLVYSNSVIKSYYERLKLVGKTPKVAMVACMRKLIIILNTMVKKNTHWEANSM